MKRMIRANNYHNSLVDYRVYELEDDEELDCILSTGDQDEAIEYARKYSKDNRVDTHIVACPVDPDDPATKDYFEYDLQVEPYEVIWES